MHSKTRTFGMIIYLALFLQLLSLNVYANVNESAPADLSQSDDWFGLMVFLQIIAISGISVFIFLWYRERKHRIELTKFNNAFIHFERDSSALNENLFETKHLKRLATYTSQILETRDNALKTLNVNKELLLYHSSLIENVNEAIISTDMNYRMRSWNRAAKQIFGYNVDQVIGKNLLELLGLRYIGTTQSVVNEILKNVGNWEGELQFVSQTGETIYLFGSISIIKNSNKSCGMVGIFSNITKRKKAQKAYLESEKLFRSMFNIANIGNCIFDKNLKFEKVNKYLLDLLEYSAGDLRKRKLNEVVEQNDWKRYQNEFEGLFAEDNKSIKLEIRLKKKSGNAIWVEVSFKTIKIDSSNQTQLICSVVDIDRRKNNEQALLESSLKFKNILNNINEGFFRVDNRFEIVLLSPSLQKIIGDDKGKNYIGERLHDIFKPRESMDHMINELNEYGMINNYKLTIKVENRERILTVNAKRWDEKAGKRSGYDGLVRDTTIEFRAQQALKESEAKYRTLVEDAQIGITILQGDKIIFANKAFFKMMNYRDITDVDPLEVKKLNDPIINQKDQKSYDYFIERTEDRVHYEQDVIRSDGKLVSMSITSSTIRIGGEICIQSTYINNTKRKNAIEALRSSERKYRMLAMNSNDVIWTMKTDKTVTYISPSINNLLGYSSDHSKAQEIIQKIGAEFIAQLTDNSHDNRKPNSIESTRILHKISKKDSSVIWVEVSMSPLIDEQGNLTGIIGNARDVTDRKQAEIQLNNKVKYLKGISECQQLLMRDDLSFEEGIEQTLSIVRELFDTCRTYLYENYEDENLGIYAIRKFLIQSKRCSFRLQGSINRKIVFNNGYQRWKNTFMRGKPIKGLITDFSKEEQILLNAQKTISTIMIPLIIDGKWVGMIGFDETHFERQWTSEEKHLMQTVGDIIVSYLERKRARSDLEIEREKLLKEMDSKTHDLSTANAELSRAARLKDEFLANMSHELRTPLNAILGMSEALQEQIYGPMNDKELKTLKTIEESGQHLLELINDILDLSKIGVGKLTLDKNDVSIDSVCNSCLRMIRQSATQKHIQVLFRTNCEGETAYADERRLKQIIVNLLTNAVKFTGENKKVGLEVFAETDANKISFAIWDEGAGIDEHELSNLFKPFVQLDSSLARKHEGTGLGLSMVEKLAKMHCGSITLESVPGSGSRFIVTIPKNRVKTDKVKRDEALNKITRKNKVSAFLVDEKSNSLKNIVSYLNAENIENEIHAQGEGSVEKIQVAKPDVIILDLFLPDKSGWEVLKEVKNNDNTKNIPVIVVSALDEASKGLELGADSYLLKPVTKQQLLLAITQASPKKEGIKALLIMSDQEHTVNSKKKVLIVDENENTISVLMDSLIANNYRVLVARNGVEAVKRAKEEKPDFVIIEHRLPILDGYHAISKIRDVSELIDVPIIATSSLILPGDKSKMLAIGADVFLPKPLDIVTLEKCIDAFRLENTSSNL